MTKSMSLVQVPSMKILSSYIAPWALAREPVPVHLIWKTDFEYDQIRITLPSAFEMADVHNSADAATSGHVTTITRLKKDGYLSFNVKAKTTYGEPMHRENIRIEFFHSGVLLSEMKLEAKIVRPVLGLLQPPPEIVLQETTTPEHPIRLRVGYNGRGKAQVRYEVRASGRIITRTETFLSQVLKQMRDRFEGRAAKPHDDRLAAEVEIDPSMIREMVEAMMRLFSGEERPSPEQVELLTELRAQLADPKFKDRFAEILHSEVERMWIGSVLSLIQRNPREDIELEQDTAFAIFKGGIEHIDVILRYRDAYGNEYEPLVAPIKVRDERKSPGATIEVPVKVDWVLEQGAA